MCRHDSHLHLRLPLSPISLYALLVGIEADIVINTYALLVGIEDLMVLEAMAGMKFETIRTLQNY